MTEPQQPPDEATVRRDIGMVIGGSFNVDEIGPDRHAEVVARVRAHPQTYLDAVADTYLGAAFDPLTQSRLHLPHIFEILRGTGPEVTRLARNLLSHFDTALVIYDQVHSRAALEQVLPEDTVNLLVRLDDRRRALRAFLAREG